MEEKKKLRQLVSESIKVPNAKVEKVTSIMETFLNGDMDGFKKIRIITTQVASEKVASTVATFLLEDMHDMRIIRVTTREVILS